MSTMYSVVSFGCNSGHNDMYSPRTTLFHDREKAYAYYLKLKSEVTGCEYISYEMYDDFSTKDTECVIQSGEDAKRPVGVSITKHIVE
jgi:hypothetical protein